MTLTFSWKQIGIVAFFSALFFIVGLGAGAALAGDSLPPEIAAALSGLVLLLIATVGGAIRVIASRIETLRPELDRNTRLTQQAVSAAKGAQGAAEEANNAVSSLQVATVDQLELDRLRRIESVVLDFPECAPCRDKLRSLTERRRLYPPSPALGEEPAQ